MLDGVGRRSLRPAGDGEMNGADGLFLAASGRAGDTGNRDRMIGAADFQAAFGHGADHFFGDSAVLLQRFVGNAEDVVLGFVGVGDVAAMNNAG